MSTFTTNIEVQKTYPAMQYEPDTTNEPSGVWYEDHEIDGVMYRAANATFDDKVHFTWSLKIPSQPAYCITQNADGSTSYLYMGADSGVWSTSSWLGTGQLVMYHAVNYGLKANDDTAGATNLIALKAAVDAAFANGGLVFMPAGVYTITGTVSLNFSGVPGNDEGLIIAGVGGSTELVQTTEANTFSITGLNGGRGVRFKDLRMSNTTQTVLPPGYDLGASAAIYVSNSQNVTCERVYFDSALQAMYLDNRSEQCGLFNCTIYYNNAAGATMLYLGGSENYVQDCDISQLKINHTPNPGPADCTGIVVSPAGGAVYIGNTHISDFTNGIEVQGSSTNLTRLHCSNAICECWSKGVYIQPQNNGVDIYDLFFDSCIFMRSGGSTDTAAIGVYIDTNGGANGNVANIFLNNCLVFGWSGPGVQINAGQNIVITGGRYSSNATSESTSGGIAVTGTAADVTIAGADCTSTLPQPAFGPQPHALSITAAVQGLYVRGCTFGTYAPNVPVYLSSAGTQIEITDCAGYNDLAAALTTTPPASPFSGATFNYFGPVTVYGANSSQLQVSLAGSPAGMGNGTFVLGPGQTLTYGIALGGHTWTTFLMVGQ